MTQPKHRTEGSEAPFSATFTVTAETQSELAHLLRGIAALLEESPTGRGKASGPLGRWRLPEEWEAASSPPLRTVTRPASAEALGWYGNRGLDFLDHLTRESRQAVLYVARHAPRVTVDDLAEEIGKEPGSQLAGALSSIGYAWKRLGAPEPPFERVRSMYEMDPRLASHLLRLVGEGGAARETSSTAEPEGDRGPATGPSRPASRR